MPETQSTPESEPVLAHTERDVIYLLTDPEGLRHWSVAEVGREMEDEGDAADALRALERAGLIHRDSDGFVFATRPAIRFRELTGAFI